MLTSQCDHLEAVRYHLDRPHLLVDDAVMRALRKGSDDWLLHEYLNRPDLAIIFDSAGAEVPCSGGSLASYLHRFYVLEIDAYGALWRAALLYYVNAIHPSQRQAAGVAVGDDGEASITLAGAAAALYWWGENADASAAAGNAGAGGRGRRRALSEAQRSMVEAGWMLALVTCTRHAAVTVGTVTLGWEPVPGPAGSRRPPGDVVRPDCRHPAAQGAGRAGACAGTRGLVRA